MTQTHGGVMFNCPAGKQMEIVFDDETATLYEGSRPPKTLPRQVSGSGFRYGNAETQLVGKGQEIILMKHNQKPVTCLGAEKSIGPTNRQG